MDDDDGGPMVTTMESPQQTTTSTTTTTTTTTTETSTTESSGGGQSVFPLVPMPSIEGYTHVRSLEIEVVADTKSSFRPIAPNAYRGDDVPTGSEEGDKLAIDLVNQRGVIGSDPPWICEGIMFAPHINKDGQAVFYLAIPESHQDKPGAEFVIMSPEAVKNVWQNKLLARMVAFGLVNIYDHDGTLLKDSKALMLDDYAGAVKENWRRNLQDPNFYIGMIGAVGGGLAAGGGVRVAGVAGKVAETAIITYYPPNSGFLGSTTKELLPVGLRIDRYGGSSVSRLFSPVGTPATQRSLPPGVASLPLRTFEVVRPIAVQRGTVAPWFGEIGFGKQFYSPMTLDELLSSGYLKEIK